MEPSNVRAHAPKRWWVACLVLASALAVVGCDAEPEGPAAPEQGDVLGRSTSELDETGGCTDDAGGVRCTDDDAPVDDDVPPGGVDALAPPGSRSPLDPRAEPDPIPWTPRHGHGQDA